MPFPAARRKERATSREQKDPVNIDRDRLTEEEGTETHVSWMVEAFDAGKKHVCLVS